MCLCVDARHHMPASQCMHIYLPGCSTLVHSVHTQTRVAYYAEVCMLAITCTLARACRYTRMDTRHLLVAWVHECLSPTICVRMYARQHMHARQGTHVYIYGCPTVVRSVGTCSRAWMLDAYYNRAYIDARRLCIHACSTLVHTCMLDACS